MLTIIAEWVSYSKTLLTLMTFTSQQILITLTNNLQWQQWQKQHWLNPNPWSKNIKVGIKDFTVIKVRHKAIEILIGQQPPSNPNPKFKTKNAVWKKWEQFLQAPLQDYYRNFPSQISKNVIDQQTNRLTELIAAFAACFSDLTEIPNKRAKGWWNNNTKVARKEMKESVRKYKLRKSPAKLRKMVEVKEKYQPAISEANSNNINLTQNS